MHTYFIFGIFIFFLNTLCVISLIFIERRKPTTTWAWILVLTLLPGIGFLIYLIFGQNLSREKIFKQKTLRDEKKAYILEKKLNLTNGKIDVTNEFSDLLKMNFNHCGSIYTIGNEVEVYTKGSDKFKNLLKDIKNAKKFIHLEYYIFRFDSLGQEIINALKEKVDEGLEVRLLVDGMGSRTLACKYKKYIRSLGINFEVFFPGLFTYINLRINYRNHRKLAIIDGEIGYVGGFNVGDEYVNGGDMFPFWRDTHLRIQGEAVNELNKRFLMDWDYAAKEDLFNNKKYFPLAKNLGSIGIQVVSSGPDNKEEYIENSYLKIINNAKKNVYIQTPYLVLDDSLINALKISALSGVDVKIMVPYKNDAIYMKWAVNSNIALLIDCGVKFYKYKKGFIHAKTIVADSNVASVGTANFDIRSFKLNFEVVSVIYNEKLVRKLENIFINDEKNCFILSKENFAHRKKTTKIMEALIRLVSPIL
ncbi:cardiolipin synthase [Clostridium tarantellae]|uniref:Cardiolipin synthase n=1 Tax=Clostridium tarantellae TaxID=39493 RepID=A0A6I1MVQ1_9CLOT|nr:cardiolipin synthase [Clostridium tarantellae]MPQ44911.1 cardiolipin synthase [Clostridium tarantellae]